MTGARTYAAFGLVIRSDFALEVLEEIEAPDGAVDLTVTRTGGLLRDDHPPVDPYFDIRPGHQYMLWRAVGVFEIRDDDTVLVEPHAGISDHLVSQAFLGLVMSVVLERRQLLCLHASAVNVSGRAALFLGDKGAGKSTTSGAMLARGHLPVTDDLVAVEGAGEGGARPVIRPGFSAMKLWPDSIAALDLGEEQSDRLIHPGTTKVQKRMPVPIPQRSVPMGAGFVLRRSADTRETAARRLAPHDALQMILRYTFMARYGETQLGPEHLRRHMQRCAGVVATVPVYDLMISEDLGGLDRLGAVIEDCVAAA